jgi:hypothetical protein
VSESIEVSTARLTDVELRTLRGTYAAMSLAEPSRTVSAWYADLAHAIDRALSARVFEWANLVHAATLPPTPVAEHSDPCAGDGD